MDKFDRAVVVLLVCLVIIYAGLWAWAIHAQSQMDECGSCNITSVEQQILED